MGGDVAEVRLADCEHVWSCDAEEVLRGLGNEERGGEGEAEPHPANVPFPQLATPDLGASEAVGCAETRKDEDCQKTDQDSRGNERHEDERSDGDGIGSEGKGDVQIQQGKGSFIRLDGTESSSDTSYYAELLLASRTRSFSKS